MNILDIPFIVEIFFVISTLVFVITVYAIFPAIVFQKRTDFKSKMISSLWLRYIRSVLFGIKTTSNPPKKKELKKLFLTIYNG